MLRTVKDFGAIGDGQADDSAAIAHAVSEGAGNLHFPPGDYRITRSIEIDLAKSGRISVAGSGTAKVIMTGAGPAFRMAGSHDASADPVGFAPGIWQRERLPLISQIEIEGAHPEADGIYLEGTMQSTIEGVLLRKLRHGIHVHRRARNVLITHTHIYDLSGIGVFFEEANLHQVIISASHISYCRQSGIKIQGGQVRNVQITGNDIEYNYDHAAGENAGPSAEIWFDTSAGNATIREGTIASNTIQSRYSPGGSNIRITGRGTDERQHAGMIAISGNLIGSQEVNVRLESCRGIALSGNVIYSGHQRNLLAEDSRNLVVSGNSFDHNPDYLPKELATGIRFVRCTHSSFSTSSIQDAFAGAHTVETPAPLVRQGLLELVDCDTFSVTGVQVLDAGGDGIYLENCRRTLLANCQVLDTRPEKKMRCAVRWLGTGEGNRLEGNALEAGAEDTLHLAPTAGVSRSDRSAGSG